MSTPDHSETTPLQVTRSTPLERWLWRSYVRSAIIPLLVIELSFLAIYWISNQIVHRENIAAVSEISRDYMQDAAKREAVSISKNYAQISQTTDMFARQTLKALRGNYDPPASEKARYAMARGGAFYTRFDNGTTASFYTGVKPVGTEEIRKVWRLAALDPLMIDLKQSNPEVASIYFNSFDSYNRIYPYFDVLEQYAPRMDIPSYNFYYEADAKHNPSRKPTWTDAYIDPAGHGWMVSSIAPVWNGDKLEGVVGLDVTLNAIIDRLTSLDLPWGGYAMLLDRKGQILALPPEGEADFGLKELTDHHYSQAILADTFKPDSFNVNRRADTRPLAAAMAKSADGEAVLEFDGPHLASFAKIDGLGWTLVVVAPTSNIYAGANTLRNRLETVGYVMLGGLLVFYAVFFVLLYRRAQSMSASVASPLAAIAGLMSRIGRGEYRQGFAGSQVEELDRLGRQLVRTGEELGDAHDKILAQERLVSRALLRQRQFHDEQSRFVRIMSHELRTPLSVIDSGAQIISRKASDLSPDALQKRAGKMRDAVRRISELLQRLVSDFVPLEEQPDFTEAEPAPVNRLVRSIATGNIPEERLSLLLPDLDVEVSDGTSLAIALRAVIDNALRYSPAGTPITVSAHVAEGRAVIAVADSGPGIPDEELPLIGERFFRGSNATGTEGAGIGLYLARRSLEAIGGTLTIASAPEGTTVTCSVPLFSALPVPAADRTPEGAA